MPASKAAFDKLDAPKRDAALDELDKLNKKWGYYGAPPVPRDLLAHYYYDEEPRGEWVIVEVGATDTSHTLKRTGIAFWDRTTRAGVREVPRPLQPGHRHAARAQGDGAARRRRGVTGSRGVGGARPMPGRTGVPVRVTGVPMTAKYATTCAVCASGIRPGEEIRKSGGGWAHEPCAGSTARRAGRPASRWSAPASGDMPAADGALEVWTDGACSGNPGPGGWAWATQDGRQDSGGEAAHHQPAHGDPRRAGGGAGAARAARRWSATPPTSSTASATAGGGAGSPAAG